MAIRLEEVQLPFKVDNKAALAGIGAITAAVAAVGAAMALTVKATFDWAGELDSIQDVMGVTNKEAAALNFVLRKSGTETEKLTKGMVILEKGLVKADGSLDTTGKRLQDFGIQALDINGKVKDQAVLIDEIGKKYNSFSTQAERVNFLTELFGKSGADLIDVFDTLAKEGGLDATTEKVEKLGLAIDPQKYEDFQRNIEEVKLAFLGLGITIVDSLMPALRDVNTWWSNKGLPAFMDMKKWLDVNIPIAIQNSKRQWEAIGTTWRTNINPVISELIGLWTNLSAIASRLDPQVGEIAGKFTILGATQRVAVGWAAVVNGALDAVAGFLRTINGLLSSGIALWDRFRSAAANAAGASASVSLPSSSRGGAGGRTPARRAFGGNVMAGQTYQINEKEFFTPKTGGKISPTQTTTVKISDNDLEKIGKAVARAIVPQLAKVM